MSVNIENPATVSKFSIFFIFSPNKAFSELFSKIQLKDPKALEFFQNRGKFENRHFGLPPPLKIDENDEKLSN